ncbi:MAG: diadenylate cyclase CdaA [Deltaproteobacteria bacterium]|nr:MAG: diadenylate cyclase CdaA [Deltaproteobacteria bacterium]
MTEYFSGFSWKDAADILIVAWIIYRVILLVKGTRAAQMLIGLGFITLVYFLSQELGLFTLRWILGYFLAPIVLIIIILFQNDIRRALTQVGRTPLFSDPGFLGEAPILEEVVRASVSLASKKIGALIVWERLTGLNDYIEGGVSIDARVTKEILISIFHTTSPVHDGAVIIQNGRITTAGCFLPLTINPDHSKELGARHRAALGITEDTDAVVIIISEEQGTISLAVGGELTRKLDGPTLRQGLQDLLGPKKRER